jgi:hypothetical protein
VDFCATKGIPHDFTTVKSCFNLSSDHSPVLVTLTIKVPPKTEENDTIQWASWNAIPEHTDILTTLDCPIQIKQKIEEKRRLRKACHLF